MAPLAVPSSGASSLLDSARRAAQEALDLLARAAEDDDVVDTVARSVEAGHVLFLLAEGSSGWLAEAVASSIRGHFRQAHWPPVLLLTDETRLLTLIGCDYDAADPLCRQVETLARQGDVVVLLTGRQASSDAVGAARLAAGQEAIVAALGAPPPAAECQASVTLPEAAAGQVARCQLLLGQALAAGLAGRLPTDRPDDVPSALLTFPCANCGATLAVPRHLAGHRGTCPVCYNNTQLARDAAPHTEHRAHMRFALRECTVAAWLTSADQPTVAVPGEIRLENLSRGGLLFVVGGCPLEIQPDDAVLIDLTTPAFEHPLRVAGTVNRVTREAARQHVGVVFESPPPAVAERLRLLERNIVLRNLAGRAGPAQHARAQSSEQAPPGQRLR